MAGSLSKHRKSEDTQLVIDGVSLDDISLAEFDRRVIAACGTLCGIDEAGRGPLAGPVCTAAVILDENAPIEGLNDSKKLTEKKRELLYDEIIDKAKAFCIAFGTVEEIENGDILTATLEAMKKAYEGMEESADIILVDGDVLPPIEGNVRNMKKGDAKSASVAAASILAKVTRDRYMTALAEKYPGYGFEKHKGYGTKAHYEAVDKLGLCEVHRKSFFTKYFAKKNG